MWGQLILTHRVARVKRKDTLQIQVLEAHDDVLRLNRARAAQVARV